MRTGDKTGVKCFPCVLLTQDEFLALKIGLPGVSSGRKGRRGARKGKRKERREGGEKERKKEGRNGRWKERRKERRRKIL